jgi:L-alanine-DL-glutamate epimerase-like enolase superfamily enzyme
VAARLSSRAVRQPGVSILLVKVDTDAGLIGWGEAFGHSVAPATRHAMDSLVAPVFIGRNPTDITALMKQAQQNLHLFGRSGPVMYALSTSSIEAAQRSWATWMEDECEDARHGCIRA